MPNNNDAETKSVKPAPKGQDSGNSGLYGQTTLNSENSFNNSGGLYGLVNVARQKDVVDNGPMLHAAGVFRPSTARYTVVKDDTLYSIAIRFNTSTDAIIICNRLGGNTISIGQMLSVPRTQPVPVQHQPSGALTPSTRQVSTTTDVSATPTQTSTPVVTTTQATTQVPATTQPVTTSTQTPTVTSHTRQTSTTTQTDSLVTPPVQTDTSVTTPAVTAVDSAQTSTTPAHDTTAAPVKTPAVVQTPAQTPAKVLPDVTQEQVGANVVKNMRKVNTSGDYEYVGPDDNPTGLMNPKYWKRVAFCSFSLQPQASPSQALRDALAGPTRLECFSTTKAILLKTILDQIGDDAFNKYFAWKSENDPGLLVSVPQDAIHTHYIDRLEDFLYNPGITKVEDLVKGDWIYFRGDPRYTRKHPAGLWQGENCIYEGNNTFSGFGANKADLGKLTAITQAEYDKDPTKYDKAAKGYDPQLETSKDGKAVGLLWGSVRRLDVQKINDLKKGL